jgi:RNA polymerase sigma factor (sigma-70 family)
MNPPDLEQRLSRIATLWSVVFEARGAPGMDPDDARRRLLMRYHSPVYRYLLGAVRDEDVASDLCQEFAIRFLRGDFHRADPGRGRFRDYVKRALINLVNDYHRQRQAKPAALAIDVAAPVVDDEASFEATWREALLSQTWDALKKAQPAYHAVLQMRVEDEKITSNAMAERLTQLLGKPMTPENVRKALQRAHAKFADLLLDQVAASLREPTNEDLEAELQALDLLKYCRSVLEQRVSRNK